MRITRHARKRIKERKGLPLRSHERHIDQVIQQGRLYSRTGREIFTMFFQGFFYIFALSHQLEAIMVTLYRADSVHAHYFNRQVTSKIEKR